MGINRLELCLFKREENGVTEVGILLNKGGLGIIDATGEKVKKVWSYEVKSDFSLEIGYLFEKHIKNINN